MVDVAHDRHHRRALGKVLVGILENRLEVDVVGRVSDLDFLVELVGEHLDRVVGERLRERRHLAERHQLLDHLRHGHAEVLADVLHGRSGIHADEVGGPQRRVVDRRDRLFVGAATAPSTSRPALGLIRRPALLAPRGLGVDHHAPPSSRADLTWRALPRARVARGAHALCHSGPGLRGGLGSRRRRRCTRRRGPGPRGRGLTWRGGTAGSSGRRGSRPRGAGTGRR